MSVNSNLVQRARQCLYSLKREYGGPVDIYKLVDSTTDVKTGIKTLNTRRFRVKRAIVMPNRIDRTAKQSISLISANKEFVTGGSTDIGTRDIIVDRRDCPTLPSLTADDWFVYNGRKFQIATVQEFEASTGWIITTHELVGEVPDEGATIRLSVTDSLDLTSSAGTG